MFRRIHWRITTAYVTLIVLVLLGVGLSMATILNDQRLHSLAAEALLDLVVTRFVLVLAIAAAIASVLAMLLAVMVARATTVPLDLMTRMARRVAAGQFDERVAVRTRDEVAELAAALNAMAADLQSAISAIEARRAELTAILAAMADGVIIVDGDRRVVALNRAAERLLEISEEAARGRSVAEVVRHHDLIARLAESQRNDTPLVIELGGGRRQVQVVVTPVRVANGRRYVILFQDVTELRQAETIRRDFVANVSHELRTPLASLRALVETLEDGALEDPPAAREFLARMHVEVDGLAQMVGELLELARIESGRVQLHLAWSDVGRSVRVAAERLQPQAERQGVSLAIVPPSEPVHAVIDENRLQQVIVNLVHNAIKFTPPGGRVSVSVEPRDQRVAIVVADTGMGVDPAELPRLFERFYKADRSRASSGTGLGLAIVKHLVQAHGGEVRAESGGPGQGATFTVLLPVGGPPNEHGPRLRRSSFSV